MRVGQLPRKPLHVRSREPKTDSQIACRSSLFAPTSQEPVELRATYMRDAAWEVSEHPQAGRVPLSPRLHKINDSHSYRPRIRPMYRLSPRRINALRLAHSGPLVNPRFTPAGTCFDCPRWPSASTSCLARLVRSCPHSRAAPAAADIANPARDKLFPSQFELLDSWIAGVGANECDI